MQGAPLAVPLGSGRVDFEGLLPPLRVSVFDLRMGEGSGGPRSMPISWQCSAPTSQFCLVYTGRTVGVGPGGWFKPI